MNDIQTPFLVDLSDLLFDDNYHQSKNKNINKNHKQNEISQKLKNKISSQLERDNISQNPERKTEKPENIKKPKEKEKSPPNLPPSTTKEPKNEKKIIDSFYNQIDITSSLNLLLNEKIKKVKTTPEKDLKESKEGDNFMEDFFSPVTTSKNPEKEIKISNSKDREKKINHNENGPKDNYNRQQGQKSSHNDNSKKEQRTHQKKLNFNYEYDKHNHNWKPKKEKQNTNYPDIVLTNTSNDFMKISNINDRNRNFACLLEKDSKNQNSNDFSGISHEKEKHNGQENSKYFQHKVPRPSGNQKNLNSISDSNKLNEDYINIPLCNFSPIFFSNLKEKLNLISLRNINRNNGHIYDKLNMSDMTESMDVSHSFTKDYSIWNQNRNRFFTFYQKTFEDPLLQKHIFLHPGLRLSFLKAYPSNKKLISKDYLYNVVNGEVGHVYGKIKDFHEKEIYYVKLLKDRDIEEIYTNIFVTEKILKKKLNRREISAEFIQNELNISGH